MAEPTVQFIDKSTGEPIAGALNTMSYDADVVHDIVNEGVREIQNKLDNAITMSRAQRTPDPNLTSLWLEIKDQEIVGEFNNWYRKG